LRLHFEGQQFVAPEGQQLEFFNTHVVDIACPKKGCSGKLKATLGYLRKSPTSKCPRCGSKIEFNGKDLDKALRDIRRSLEKFNWTLKKLSK
jgi:hypothetical protein